MIVTGSAAALLTLGAWDQSKEILEKLSAVSAQQVAMSVTVGAIKEQVSNQFARNDQAIASAVADIRALDQRVRLLETALATMGATKN